MRFSRINKFLDEDYPEFVMNERAGLGTPLHFAALSGSLEMAKFLIEKKRTLLLETRMGAPLSAGRFIKGTMKWLNF